MRRRTFMGALAGGAAVACGPAGNDGSAGGGAGAVTGSSTVADSARPDLPRVDILAGPTPLDFLPRLTEALGGPRIYAKRDDLTPTGLGGNKNRKLEYLIAEAQRIGADTLVTVGGVQSNHCRQTAANAARFGFACELVLSQTAKSTSPLYMEGGNLILNGLFGAKPNFVGADESRSDLADAVMARLQAAGASPMLIGSGGSDSIGSFGYRRAAHELLAQLDAQGIAPKALYHATGSAGTQSGLLLGIHEDGRELPVEGISVSGSSERVAARVEELMAEMAPKVGLEAPPKELIRVDDGHIGEAYGLVTAAGREAMELCASLEGLVLDPTYTSKGMGALIAHIREGRFGQDDAVVFLHTGGAPAVFAYEEFVPERAPMG